MSSNKITILGSGDTLGTPVPGCKKPACTDTDPKSSRYRFGLMIQLNGTNILIDPNPDLKWQLIDNDFHPKDIDHILVTHMHSDHINGLGDIFYRRDNITKLWYGDHPVNEKLIDYWRYREQEGVIEFNTYQDYKTINLDSNVAVTPVTMNHGFPASGFVISGFGKKIGIATDSNSNLPKQTMEELRSVDCLFIDTFSENKEQIRGVYEDSNIEVPDLDSEWFHMTMEDVKEIHKKIDSKKTFTIHMSRHMSPHQELVNRYETDDFKVGFDGLVQYI